MEVSTGHFVYIEMLKILDMLSGCFPFNSQQKS